MPKPRRSKRAELLNRTVDVTTFRVSLRVGVDEPSDPEPEIEVKPWLELRGLLSEPVRQTSAITLSIYPDERKKVGTARLAAVGAIIGLGALSMPLSACYTQNLTACGCSHYLAISSTGG